MRLPVSALPDQLRAGWLTLRRFVTEHASAATVVAGLPAQRHKH